MLLSTNQVSCQGSTVHCRAVLDLHRLVEILSLNKMNDYGGTKHTGVPVKTLKKLLKKAGLKVSGKKATLTRRAKKAKLFGGLGLGRAPKSSAATFFNKITNDQFNKEQAPINAEQAKFNEAITEVRKNAEALNPLAKAQQEDFDRKNSQQTLEAVVNDGGKKKRSRRR